MKKKLPPLYAVMGDPIAHSQSPMLHTQFAAQCGLLLRYEKIRSSSDSFEDHVIHFFNQGGMGLNVTHPFKARAAAMAPMRTDRCLEAGVANTLWMKKGVIHADNTDGVGLVRNLNHFFTLTKKRILILGAGGAARGIIGALGRELPQEIVVSNRTEANARALQVTFSAIKLMKWEALAGEFDLIIQATSANLNNECLNLPNALLKNHPLCYDLTYNSMGLTPFVHWAKTQGCMALDGMGMLKEQAAEAFFIWHGVRPTL